MVLGDGGLGCARDVAWGFLWKIPSAEQPTGIEGSKGNQIDGIGLALEVQSVIEVWRELPGRKGEEKDGRISKSLK